MKVTTHLCKILDLGMSGNLFGGQLMYWLDEAAAVYARQMTAEPKVVTRHFSEAVFQKPIHLSDVIEFHCIEPRKGRTSITFKIQVIVDGDIRFQAAATFVAVDDNGKSKPIDWSKSPLAGQTE